MLFDHRALRAAAIAFASAAAVPAKAEYQVPVMRLSGEWQTSFGLMQMSVDTFEGAAQARILEPSGSAPRYYLWRHPLDAGEPDGSANFYWVSATGKCRIYNPKCVEGRVSLKVDQTGRSFEATTISGRPIEGSTRWSANRLRNSTAAERTFADWLGQWSSTNGPITFRVEGEVLVGEFQKPGTTGSQGRGLVALFPGGSGAWSLPNASSLQRGRADLRLAADKWSFTGTYEYSRADDAGANTSKVTWAGERVAANSAPQQPQPGPVVAQPLPYTPPADPSHVLDQPPLPATGTPPAQTPPSGSASFKPLNRVDVRVDRVVVARGYSTHQVHVFVTMKNTSATPQYHTGWLKVVLADADGVSWERSQPYRATREPAELFAETPVIQPGGELKSRYIFTPEVDAQLTTVTLSEGGKSATFPVSGL